VRPFRTTLRLTRLGDQEFETIFHQMLRTHIAKSLTSYLATPALSWGSFHYLLCQDPLIGYGTLEKLTNRDPKELDWIIKQALSPAVRRKSRNRLGRLPPRMS